jgi:glc operon protein GlcG
LPVGFGVVLVAVVLPCGDFVGEDLLVGDAAIQTLRRENAAFGFGHVEPAAVLGRVVPFEALDEPAGLGRGKGLKNNWGMAIAILDSTGHIVMLHKLDNTQYGSIAVAEDKARSALYYRRPSKVFEDLVAQGGLGLRTLALRGATPLEGGIPLVADGKIVGAIGVSGATSVQDGQVAKAGADAAK